MPAEARHYVFCGVVVSSTLALPPLRRAAARARPTCRITVAHAAAADVEVAWLHQWRGRRGPRWLRIGRLVGAANPDYLLRFPGLADFEVSADARRVVVRPQPSLPIETLRHLLIDQVLPLVTSRHGRLSLHASAVHLPRFGTIGFVGETGRGKSTMAAALALGGAQIVADDCLAIHLGGRSAAAIPAYPGLRLWPELGGRRLLPPARERPVAHYSTKQRIDGAGLRYRAAPSPLRALFLLRPRSSRGAAAEITRCAPSARIIGLLRCAYMLDVEDRRELAAVFDRLALAAARVPVLRLRIRDGHGRLAAAAEAIRRYAADASSVLPS